MIIIVQPRKKRYEDPAAPRPARPRRRRLLFFSAMRSIAPPKTQSTTQLYGGEYRSSPQQLSRERHNTRTVVRLSLHEQHGSGANSDYYHVVQCTTS